MIERNLRKAIRYQVAVTVSFYWRGVDGSLHEAQGVTRNISSDGALIASSHVPLVGEVIEATILLPRVEGQGNGMKLFGKGAVLRAAKRTESDSDSSACEFAVSVPWHRQNKGSGLGSQ